MRYLILLIPILIGCAEASEPAKKGLFSYWRSESAIWDLRGRTFGENVVKIGLPASGCHCDVDINGSATSGTMTFSNCYSWGSGNCVDRFGLFDYEIVNNVLWICAVGCESFR